MATPSVYSKMDLIPRSKVSQQLSIINKLSVPRGCARSSKAKSTDIDLEIRESIKRQQEFDLKIQKELLKLNFPLDYYRKQQVFPKEKRKSERHKTLNVPPVTACEVNRRVKSVPPAVNNSTEKEKSPKSPLFRYSFNNYSVNYDLPPLLKSIPIHLDPNLKFPKKKSPKESHEKSVREDRINKMDTLINKCTYSKDNFGNYIEDNLKTSTNSSHQFYGFVEKLVENVRFGSNDETLEKIMIFQKDDEKLNRKLKKSSDEIQKELDLSTPRVIKTSLARGRRSSVA